MTAPEPTDASSDLGLVQAARAGNRRAFGDLVERYQVAVCSIAYAFTGSLAQSEEIAQETFVDAWGSLSELRHPERFRGWLYGITRNRCHRAKRSRSQNNRSLVHSTVEVTSLEPSPLERIITREEERVVWRALGQIPEIYRLPLVLFYREEQSVEIVATALEITVDSAKKRLSRGRRLLHQEVTRMLESTLSRTRPGKEFTAAVLAAILTGAAGPAAASPAGGAVRWSASKMVLLVTGIVVLPALFWAGSTRTNDGKPQGPSAARSPAATAELAPSRWPSSFSGWTLADPTEQLRGATPGRSAIVFAFDFEDGITPRNLTDGWVVPCPVGSGSRFCVLGSANQNGLKYGSTVAVDAPTPEWFSYEEDLALEFEYWLGAEGTRLYIQTWVPDKQLNFGMSISSGVVYGRWARAMLRVSDLVTSVRGKASGMEKGDRFSNVNVIGGRFAGSVFYVDNLRLVEYEPGMLPERGRADLQVRR